MMKRMTAMTKRTMTDNRSAFIRNQGDEQRADNLPLLLARTIVGKSKPSILK